MKRRYYLAVCIIFLLLIVLLSNIYSDDVIWDWTVQPGSSDVDEGRCITSDSSGNIYVTGYTRNSLDGNTSHGSDDIFITKYNTDGTRLWTVQPGTSAADLGYYIALDSSSNIYVTGITRGSLDGNTNHGGPDIFITKYDTDGNRLWTVQPGTSGDDYGCGIAIDSSCNIYVTGYTEGSLDGNTNHGNFDIYITKYDTDGNHLWTVQPGTVDDDYGWGIALDFLGNVYITGYTRGSLDGIANHGGLDIFIMKYNMDGTLSWIVQSGTGDNDRSYGIAVNSSCKIYITGSTGGSLDGNTNHGDLDIFIAKYNTDGTRLLTIQPGTGNNDSGYSIVQDSSGNVYITGYTWGSFDGNTNHGSYDIFITKYDTDWNRLWTIQPGTADGDVGRSISLDSSQNVFITGSTGGSLDGNTNHGNSDIFILKYNQNYVINGYVKDSTGLGISNVAVNITGDTMSNYITSADGYYEFLNLPYGNYTVTSSKTNWNFSPSNYNFSPLDEDKTNKNFTGPSKSFGKLKVYPNPVKIYSGATELIFTNCSLNTTVEIYNISGELVFTFNTDGIEYRWDLMNNNGKKVSTGIYLYIAFNNHGEKRRGKIAIIK